eukprot:Blabericola_migrator_1__5563@NODE_2832_length_2302_cov_45_041611_g1777_i0_p1_GENE_NODE_2832_length_2302_cov_45_041611_g1777_i0NODE_2832_length_2302_cov_45_041611_g1777_i0_p1_ORF_typecomplete_len195_score35_61TrbL/PF04610_14/0_11CoatB/PF10389_9/0_53CoatB/PF10389_9/9_4e03_NODE_2832_length_2302_cov_45_041611_g1777_i0256840
MRSVKGKPSKTSPRQADVLTVLICPITFPTPSTFLRILNATQEQVTESASGLAERVTESASEWAAAGFEFFNSDRSSAAEDLSDITEQITTQQASGGTTPQPFPPAFAAFIGGSMLLSFAYMAYQIFASTVRCRSTEPDTIPLGNAVPTPQSDLEPPPPYEAPPPYDSSWLNIANDSIGPSVPADPASVVQAPI